MGALTPPSAASFLVATLLWALLGAVPGFLVAGALSRRTPILDRWAVAPLVSIAVAFGAGAWSDVAGVGVPVDLALVGLALASLFAAVVLVRRRSPVIRTLRRVLSDRNDQVVLAAVVVAVLQWLIGIGLSRPGFSAVAPNSDGNAHGVRVARILLTGSVESSTVNVFDLASPESRSQFYPLGLHTVAAEVARIGGTASSLLVAITLLASVSLCLGSAALGRRVGGPRTGAAAAVAAALLLPFATYGQVWWGPVPYQVALACVPGLAVAVLGARGRGGLALGALGWGGMLGLHLSEVVVVVALVALTVMLSAATPRQKARGLLLTAGSLALGMLLAAPTVFGLLGRGGVPPQDPSAHRDPVLALLDELLHPFVVVTSASPLVQALVIVTAGSLLALTSAGILVAWRSSSGRALVLVWAGVAGLALAAYITSPGLLTVPWYGNADRLTGQAAGLLPALLGSGLVSTGRALGRRRCGRLVAFAGATGVAVVMGVQSVSDTSTALSSFSVVTPDDRAAFAWLAQHVAAGQRVLNDNRDASPWMYDATAGAADPVFAIKPSELFVGDPAFAGRLYLRDTITRIATDVRTQEEARRWSIQFVYAGARTYPGADPIVPDGVDVPGLRLVFRSGAARVYALDPLSR